MKNLKIVIGIVLLMLGIACLVFSIVSLKNGLPTEGRMAGNIFAFKPSYPNEMLAIICSFIGGMILLPIGIAVTVFGIKNRC